MQLPTGARLTSSYRADGLRHTRADAGGVETLTWDGTDVHSRAGAASELYVQGTDLVRAVGPGRNRVYHQDALGTVQALTDGSGAVETRYRVDAWGNVLSGSAPGNPYVDHGGLGYWQEPGVGLEYVRARWRDPETAEWLSVDPVEGEPRYLYAHQQPTVEADPSGGASRPGQQWNLGDVADQAFRELRRAAAQRFRETVLGGLGAVAYDTGQAALAELAPFAALLPGKNPVTKLTGLLDLFGVESPLRFLIRKGSQNWAFWEALFALLSGKRVGSLDARAKAREQQLQSLARKIYAAQGALLPPQLANLRPKDPLGWDPVAWVCGYFFGILSALLPIDLVAQSLEDPLGLGFSLIKMLNKLMQDPLWRAMQALLSLVEQIAIHRVSWEAFNAWLAHSDEPGLRLLKEFLDWVIPFLQCQPYEPFEAGQFCGLLTGTIISVALLAVGVGEFLDALKAAEVGGKVAGAGGRAAGALGRAGEEATVAAGTRGPRRVPVRPRAPRGGSGAATELKQPAQELEAALKAKGETAQGALKRARKRFTRTAKLPSKSLGKWMKVQETMPARARAYQEQITGHTSDEAYVIDGVKFDGEDGGILLEAKGPRYAKFFEENLDPKVWYLKSGGTNKLIEQARRQLRVANGQPIRWHFAEEHALKAVRRLFRDNGLTEINLVHTPPRK